MQNKTSIAEKIFSLRKAGRLTQGALAEKVGVSRAAISQFESGETSPSESTREKLSEALGYDLSEIWRQSLQPTEPQDEYIGYIGQYPILSGKGNIAVPIIAGRYNRVKWDYLRRKLSPAPDEIEKDQPFESMSLPKSLIPEGQHIIFPVYDNTMEPTFIKGDLLLFKHVSNPTWGVETVGTPITYNYIDQLSVYAVESWADNERSIHIGRFTFDDELGTLTCYCDNRSGRPQDIFALDVKDVWQFEWLLSPRSENTISKHQETVNRLQQDLRQSNQVIENLLRQIAANEHHQAAEASPVLEGLLGSLEQHEPVKPAKATKK